MNIALIGFRGTGKTTAGKKLAKRLKMEFIDLDKKIMKNAGSSIPEIFAISGEKGFRELEKKAVEEVSAGDNLCIACGGGIVLFQQNIDNLKKKSTIILLEAGPEAILSRIRHDRNRPSLTGKGTMDEIRQLLKERERGYDKAADMRFDTTHYSSEQTVQKIIDELNSRGLL